MERDMDNIEEENAAEEELKNEAAQDDTEGQAGEQPEEAQSKSSRTRGTIIEFLIYFAIIVLCVTVVPRYVIQRTIVDGPSMKDTLKNGENLLVEKVSYHFKNPDRFDIIVFYPHGRESSDYYIKRVIGLPGETIQIIGDTIYIDGEELKEDYGKDPMIFSGIAQEPLTLGEDEFFVLGDNRKVSEDSRYDSVGPVKRENIEGRAILRMYPFSKFGTID